MSNKLSIKNCNFIDYLFVLPAISVFLIFFIFPFIQGMYYSFTDWDLFNKNIHMVGLSNFIELFSENQLTKVLKNTLEYTFLTILFGNSISLLLAVIINSRNSLLKKFCRTIYLIPFLLSWVVIGFIWSFLLHPTFGINSLFEQIGIHIFNVEFLGVPSIAMYSIVFVAIWQGMGFGILIYTAGLQAIPVELIEASIVDGANSFQRFKHITFPLLAPSFTINNVIGCIGGLKVFDIIYVMTNGGPGNATDTLATMIYKQAFQTNRFGYATASSIILFFIVFIVTIVLVTYLRKREVEL